MRATRSIFVMLTLGCLATGIAGCGNDTAANPDDQGAVTFDLTLAPADARCAVITVTPTMGAAVVRCRRGSPRAPTRASGSPSRPPA